MLLQLIIAMAEDLSGGVAGITLPLSSGVEPFYVDGRHSSALGVLVCCWVGKMNPREGWVFLMGHPTLLWIIMGDKTGPFAEPLLP